MKRSDSSVKVYHELEVSNELRVGVLVLLTWKDIEAGWIPTLESWRCSQNAIGLEVSMVVVEREG